MFFLKRLHHAPRYSSCYSDHAPCLRALAVRTGGRRSRFLGQIQRGQVRTLASLSSRSVFSFFSLSLLLLLFRWFPFFSLFIIIIVFISKKIKINKYWRGRARACVSVCTCVCQCVRRRRCVSVYVCLVVGVCDAKYPFLHYYY